MKVQGSEYPPEWYVDTRSDNVTTIYHRTNIEPYEETDEEGNVTSGWQYDEEILTPQQYAEAMETAEVEAYDNGVSQATVLFLSTIEVAE